MSQLIQTARAAGMVSALHLTLARSTDWSELPREGVLRVLRDLERELDGMQARAMPGRVLIEAQEAR